nr:N-6 DNA methylase [uncultured Pseudogulbenkiania sp.]
MELQKRIEKISNSKNFKNKEEVIHTINQYMFKWIPFKAECKKYGIVLNKDYSLNVEKYSEEEHQELNDIACEVMRLIAENEPFTDIWTPIIAPLLSGNLGQYFTPPDLSELIAMLHIDNFKQGSIADPVAGSGSMIFAYLKNIVRKHGKDLTETSVFLNDIDSNMAVILTNMMFYNCVIHNIKFKTYQVECKNILTEYEIHKPVIIRIHDIAIKEKHKKNVQNFSTQYKDQLEAMDKIKARLA